MKRRYRRAWMVLLAVAAVIYIGGAFSPPLLDDADATHAEAAREMAATGDWVTLHVNGIRYLEKPPLPYWEAAACFKLFGVHEFGAHLPLAMTVLLMIGLAGMWARRAFGDRAGIYAALFFATSAGVYLFTRIFIPDLMLAFFIAAALYFFLTALEDRRSWRWYAGYTCIALGVLAKGLVALVFVGGTGFFYCALSGEWRRWREFRLLTGLLLLTALAAPWHIIAGLRNHGFFWFYFVNEHFLRFLGERYPKDYNKMPALAYWGLHLVWLFPWSFYFPVAVRNWRKEFSWRERALDFAARTRLLCIVWATLVLMFFAISTNQEYYTFPAYLPMLMLLAAGLAHEEEQGGSRKSILGGNWALATLGLAVASALAGGLWQARHLPYVSDIGTVLVERGVGNYTLSMSHFFDLTGASFAALRLPAVLAAVAFALGPLIALILRLKRRDYAATWALTLTLVLFFVAAHIALDRFGPYLSSEPLAERIAKVATPQDRVMIYGDQSYGSSLLFYLRRQIYLVNGRSSSMWFGSTFPDAPHVFLNGAELNREWKSDQRIFLFVPRENRDRADVLVPQPHYFVAESSGKVIWSNQPVR